MTPPSREKGLRHSYYDARKLPVLPEKIEAYFFSLGKTELECELFFGRELWTRPGFADVWLSSTVTLSKWTKNSLNTSRVGGHNAEKA